MILHRFAGLDAEWRALTGFGRAVCGLMAPYDRLTRNADNVTCVTCESVLAKGGPTKQIP